MTAYGYIRQSRSDEDAPSQSPLVQEDRIRALAAVRGDDDIVILPPDLNVSGGKAMDARPGFSQLLAAIEDGDCTAVYAYDLSRLFRNLKEQLVFFELVKAKAIPVRFVEGQITEVAGPTGDLLLTVVGAMNQWQREITSVKIKESFARIKRETGISYGQPAYGKRPGEDVMVVLEAFREAGSYTGAARLLNERGVPTRVKGRLWSNTVVRDIIARLAEGDGPAKDDILPRGRKGAPAGKRQFLLAGLLACSVCVERSEHQPGAGYYMTGSYSRKRSEVRYACSRSRFTPHPRGWINEDKVLPAVMDEAARARLRLTNKRKGSAEDEAKLVALAAERSRVKAMYRKGHMEEAEYDAAMAEIQEQESKLSAVRWVRSLKVPPHPETAEPGKFNAYLRRLFTRVTVDMSQKAHRGPSKWTPALAFDWVDPSLRVEEDEASLLELPRG